MSFNIISTFLIAVALAMDAFSVSMTKGFTQKHLTKAQILYYGLFFGGFQALMPIIGYFCGNVIASIVESLAPIVGFILLLAIGLNMIRESLSDDEEDITDEFSFKEVTLLAIATSIDAFAVGITIALLKDPMDFLIHNRNSCICIQHCRNIHWQKAWQLCGRQVPDSWWSHTHFNRNQNTAGLLVTL